MKSTLPALFLTLAAFPRQEGSWRADSAASLGAVAITIDDAGRIGMTFGGGCFHGHGVFTTGGAARFSIDRFSVQ